MAIKYASDNALRYFKTKLVGLINAVKSAAATAQTTANNAASAAATAQSTAGRAVAATNANTAAIATEIERAMTAEALLGTVRIERISNGAPADFTCGPSGSGLVFIARGGRGISYSALIDYWNNVNVLSNTGSIADRTPTVTAANHVVTVANNDALAIQVIFITK